MTTAYRCIVSLSNKGERIGAGSGILVNSPRPRFALAKNF